MLFTTVCEYAIRALTHLAIYGEGKPIQVKSIADEEDIPRHFLAKILNQLTYKGLVKATRGPGGGFMLTRAPEEILVRDIVQSVDGFEAIQRRCVLGLDECNDAQPCPMHDAWAGFRERFLGSVSGLSLAEMGDTLKRKRAAQ
ncbi:MAG TPA: Rrf2 family transcriptional regulator [bacterium]|nr:Rrf2 family transcriptional regulator [bacterium]